MQNYQSIYPIIRSFGEDIVKFGSIDSQAGSLAVTREGDGDVLLVPVHGWTCSRNQWAGQLALMAEFGEVLAVDLPGHGDSAPTPPDDASVVGLARVLAQLVEAERRGRPLILVGHSMGGAVALEAARLLDGQRSVVLVDTFVIPYGDLPEEQAAEIQGAFAADFVGAMANLVEANTRDDLSPTIRAMLHHDMARADTAWAVPLWGDLLRWDPQPSLSQQGVAIYAINGGMIPDVARERCAPFIEEVVMAEAKHFPQLELPEQFNLHLREVLARL